MPCTTSSRPWACSGHKGTEATLLASVADGENGYNTIAMIVAEEPAESDYRVLLPILQR